MTPFLQEVFANNLPRWRRQAVKLVGYQDADDMVQAAFIRVAESKEQVPDNPIAFIHKLVKATCVDYLRKASTRNERPTDVEEGLDLGWIGKQKEQDPETVYMANNILDDAVRAGVITQREWTVMFHLTFEGFTHEELAEVMGVSRVRVTQLVNKARKKLEAHYGSS